MLKDLAFGGIDIFPLLSALDCDYKDRLLNTLTLLLVGERTMADMFLLPCLEIKMKF